jgi:hypothetical protein
MEVESMVALLFPFLPYCYVVKDALGNMLTGGLTRVFQRTESPLVVAVDF